MKIVTLVENTALNEGLETRHGLSLYIETANHKILFDVGPDDAFIANAEKLGIDLSAVEAVFLSHSHYDHVGGLAAFFAINKTAPVYLRDNAFTPVWSDSGKYIGIDPQLASSARFVFVGESYCLDDELQLVSGFRDRVCFPFSNVALLVERDGARIPDDFEHEMALVITENNKTVLFSGCAHNGIINIINHAEAVTGKHIDTVLAGFHMYAPSSHQVESPEVIDTIANYLLERDSMYYSCHCTGADAFSRLKTTLGDRLDYACTGRVFYF